MNRHHSGHLSEEGVIMYVIGDIGAEERQHAEACASCQVKIAKLAGALAHFRGAVRDWSDRAGAQSRSIRWRYRTPASALRARGGVGLVCAAIVSSCSVADCGHVRAAIGARAPYPATMSSHAPKSGASDSFPSDAPLHAPPHNRARIPARRSAARKTTKSRFDCTNPSGFWCRAR